MQLPDFIKKALGFFEKSEESIGKITSDYQTRISALEKAALEKDTMIASLRTDLEKAGSLAGTHEATMKDLSAKIEAETKRANDTLAAQGIKPEDVPAAAAPEGAVKVSKVSAWQQYSELAAKDPRAAGEFYTKNAQAILDSQK